MFIFRDVLRKLLVRTLMRAYEAVVLITDTYFSHRRFENDGFVVIGVEYRVVVVIIKKMIVLGYSVE